MKDSLSGKKVAILATDGVEQVELTEPRKHLHQAGATTHVIAPKGPEIKAWKTKDWGDKIKVDKSLDDANPGDYDALLLPGGVINPDHLRMDPKAVEFVKAFVRSGKTIAAICHGPWTLIEADAVKGKTVTSWPSLKTDLENAGANWVDESVVVDGQFITSRKPEDIHDFSTALMDQLTEGRRQQRWAAAS